MSDMRSVQKVFHLFSLVNIVEANCPCEKWRHIYTSMHNREPFAADSSCYSLSVKRLARAHSKLRFGRFFIFKQISFQ